MLYKEKYHIKTRFQRSANIASDDNWLDFLDSYIVPPSVCNIITDILNGIQSGQGSFTLTGTYGSGKSSLCLFFMALLGDSDKIRNKAINKIPVEQVAQIKKYIKFAKKGAANFPIVAREESPIKILSEAFKCNPSPDAILAAIEKQQKNHGHINIIIDEMGKILEGDHDPFFLQTLAEYCNRSNGKITFIGCLHLAFSEYARGKARYVAEEWRKIQGRFFDIPVNTFQDEQIALIGSAIEGPGKADKAHEVIQSFAKLKSGSSLKEDKAEEKLLNPTYPLHPITTLMLAKYANSEISQSNRSIFTFLSSPERYGFQEFLENQTIGKDNFYTPDMFYDYIVTNLRNTIFASEASGTFATAQEALGGFNDNSDVQSALKTIALWQIFSPHSQIVMTAQVLKNIYPKSKTRETVKLLEEAQHIRADRKHGYIVSETTEFDLKEAKQTVLREYKAQDLKSLDAPIYINTIIGKKHLFDKGTIRSMDIIIAHLKDIDSSSERPDKIGDFILILPRDADEEKEAQKMLKSIMKEGNGKNNFYSIISDYETIGKINSEIHICSKISKENPVLKYNKIAKSIIESLIENEREALEQEVEKALRQAQWWYDGEKLGTLTAKDYSQKCSDLAKQVFYKSPVIHSELLNKNKVDSGAANGLRRLIISMSENADMQRLGLEGYSAEATLYDILLSNSNIHDASRSDNAYEMPDRKNDVCNIRPLWEATTKKLTKKDGIIPLQDIYDFWGQKPYGVKEGLKPVLMMAYILANSKNIAKYIKVDRYEFHTGLDEFFSDTLLRKPQEIGLRYVTEEQKRSSHIKTLYETALREDYIPSPSQNEILDIAISYKQFINNLPLCTKTTDNLTKEARNFRNAIRNNEDPNKMINTDVRAACPAKKIPEIVVELNQYYVKRLMAIGEQIDKQLKITPKSNGALTKRSNEVHYYATDPNVKLLSQYIQIKNWQERIEKIIQMAIGKPPDEWNDQVLNSSIVFVNGHIDEFLRVERKIRLQSDEHALICVRDSGEYREVRVSRDKVSKLLGGNRDAGDR